MKIIFIDSMNELAIHQSILDLEAIILAHYGMSAVPNKIPVAVVNGEHINIREELLKHEKEIMERIMLPISVEDKWPDVPPNMVLEIKRMYEEDLEEMANIYPRKNKKIQRKQRYNSPHWNF